MLVMTRIVSRIIDRMKLLYARKDSSTYVDYLRSKGVQIGGGISLRPKSFHIDLTRPSLITIGDNCYFNEDFTLLTHDWVTNVFINSGREFLNSSGHVTIGNNVSFGQNVMVLKGVTIGDNCFIGAGSIVTRDIPANSIAVGSPCKVVLSLEEYYQKRKNKCVEEAQEYARSIVDRYHRKPLVTDFWEEFPLFVDGDKIDEYPELSEIIKRQCGPSYAYYVKEHRAMYKSFNAFLKAAGIE